MNLYTVVENNVQKESDYLGLRNFRHIRQSPTGSRSASRPPMRRGHHTPPGGDPRGNTRYKGLSIQPQIGPPGKPPGPWKFKPPGDCNHERHRQLQAIVSEACSKNRKCIRDMCCPELDLRRQFNLDCAKARENINFECFRGGDGEHRNEVIKAYLAVATCDEWRSRKGC